MKIFEIFILSFLYYKVTSNNQNETIIHELKTVEMYEKMALKQNYVKLIHFHKDDTMFPIFNEIMI